MKSPGKDDLAEAATSPGLNRYTIHLLNRGNLPGPALTVRPLPAERPAMSQAKAGDTVHIHYTGTTTDGTLFDTTEGRDPLAFELGAGYVIPGFDKAVVGMEVGEKKNVTIPCEEAYGPHREELTFMVPRENLPPGYEPQEGEVMRMESRDGTQTNVIITHVTEDEVRMDANHPLVGKDLVFDVELVKID